MEERVVGDYALGERIGSGSFSVVWRGWHRRTGETVAVKEIGKFQLSTKVKDSLLKEITILKHVSHPNIVHLHQAIQTEERIFLVLEYCAGGDLWAYIQRHGRVSAAAARHLLRQLASGLKVLRENNLIHRDLKPQNLLLSTNDETAVLKIGDFGFARYLMPEGLADTLCGSPLYMAPEIIQNKKYDAKADLWSVGAILFQLVTGKPPFDGNSQFQLFQNILTSNELRFPQDILSDLHPDCINLCRSLLRRNPVQRLTFEEFFNHKFLAVPRTSESPLEPMHDLDGNPSNSLHVHSTKTESMNRGILSMHASRVTDSWESIEREYVLVNAHSPSMETPLPERDNSTSGLSSYTKKRVGKGTVSSMQTGALVVSSVCAAESTGSKASAALPVSQAFTASAVQKKPALQTGALVVSSVCAAESTGSKASASLPVSQAFTASEVQEKTALHPAERLQLLHQYICALTELAEEKLNIGSHLESFSIELVILAAWKEALRLCSSLITSMPLVDSLHSLTLNDSPFLERGEDSSVNLEEGVDFRRPVSVCSWAEHGFVVACDRAEKISKSFGDIDGNMEMPDAVEIIFQAALSAGKSGAVEELMGHKERAGVLYSKAITSFRFIVEVATSLQLKPPILLSPANEQRIGKYIKNLRARIVQSQTAKLPSKQTNDSPSK